ncbi:hypothetical protein B7P43_G10988 [Cryptotermes secundus]|uniref:Uncharacterized protein n=1 Tax=Cryptotermes secundus TaxID=105785 RepID=A0A2J7RML5_9NEOP|nr:hypothetical protein B7P43_G10988 [Cryptotermes secundus]
MHMSEGQFLHEEQALNKAKSLMYRARTRIIIIIIIIIAPLCRILENFRSFSNTVNSQHSMDREVRQPVDACNHIKDKKRQETNYRQTPEKENTLIHKK